MEEILDHYIPPKEQLGLWEFDGKTMPVHSYLHDKMTTSRVKD